jgi:molybdenum cofactor cytidylyltransferase
MSLAKREIAGIVLAAGMGSRMGQTKQLLSFGATTLLGEVVQSARRSDLAQVIVVLGHCAKEIEEKTDLSGTHIVINRHYTEGQATSLRAGLDAVNRQYSGAMFLLADQPLVDRQILNTLIAAWQKCKRQILIPCHNGVRGNPVIVGTPLFSALSRITGDRGARVMFEAYRDRIEKIEIHNPAILTDVDTKEDYRRLLGSWRE